MKICQYDLLDNVSDNGDIVSDDFGAECICGLVEYFESGRRVLPGIEVGHIDSGFVLLFKSGRQFVWYRCHS